MDEDKYKQMLERYGINNMPSNGVSVNVYNDYRVMPPEKEEEKDEDEEEAEEEEESSGKLRKTLRILAVIAVLSIASITLYSKYSEATDISTQLEQADDDTDEEEPQTQEEKETLEFIKKIAPIAEKMRDEYGWGYASFIIAQAILESDRGKSLLASKYNNYFGMTKSDNWEGKTVWLLTDGGQREAEFKVYSSLEESVYDRSRLIGESERYKKARECFDNNEGPERQAEETFNAGYATDPLYTKKINEISNQYNLKKYDKTTKVVDNEENTVGQTADDLVNLLAGEIGNPDPSKYIEPAGFPEGTPYCALFIGWGVDELNLKDRIFTHSYVGNMVKHYRDIGRFAEGTDLNYKPKKGDFITFNWDNDSEPYNHVAIVSEDYDENDGWVHYIGGNQEKIEKDKPRRPSESKIKFGNHQIIGYCQPDYPEQTKGVKEVIRKFNPFKILQTAKGIADYLIEKTEGLAKKAKNLVSPTKEIEEDIDDNQKENKSGREKENTGSDSDSSYNETADEFVDPEEIEDIEDIEVIDY